MNRSDLKRNMFMLKGPLARRGYDWWWHSFTGYHHVTGEAKTFFIEYFFCNPGLQEDKVVFGEGKRAPSYAMMKVGVWGEHAKQVHNFYPWHMVACDQNALSIQFGDCQLTEKRIRGACSVSAEEAQAHPEWFSDAGHLVWDLRVNKSIAYNVGYGASKIMRALNAFEMFWHAEGVQTFYEGIVTWNDETYHVEPSTCYGYADKNWGKDFTSPWIWLSSCHLIRKGTGEKLQNSALEIGGGRPKVLGMPLDRKVLIFFSLEGEAIEFNFSKFWKYNQVAFDFLEGDTENTWYVKGINRRHELEVTIHCAKKDMLLIRYESPDGMMRHKKLWNGGTGYGTVKCFNRTGRSRVLKDEFEVFNVGCEYGAY